MNTFRAYNFLLPSMKRILFLLCIHAQCLIFSVHLGQSQDLKSASYYLDDDAGAAKNALQFNVAAAVNGDISLLYERKLGESVVLSAGYGVLLPYYTYNFRSYESDNGFDPYDLDGRKIGRSYMFQFKLFSGDYFNSKVYSGLYYRDRKFSTDSIRYVKYQDFAGMVGFEHQLKAKFFVDCNLAYGARFINLPEEEIRLGDPDIVDMVSLNISIGYKF